MEGGRDLEAAMFPFEWPLSSSAKFESCREPNRSARLRARPRVRKWGRVERVAAESRTQPKSHKE